MYIFAYRYEKKKKVLVAICTVSAKIDQNKDVDVEGATTSNEQLLNSEQNACVYSNYTRIIVTNVNNVCLDLAYQYMYINCLKCCILCLILFSIFWENEELNYMELLLLLLLLLLITASEGFELLYGLCSNDTRRQTGIVRGK